jgi:hypothetical protein
VTTLPTEPPLSPDYEHPACGFHWHGKDGMDIPIRDGEPVCPRCELVRVEKLLAHRERRCEELRAESKRRGRNVLEQSEKNRVLERKIDSIREQLGAEILRAGQAESALADVRRIVSRLAAHAVGFGDVLDESDRGPWGRTVGADIAELSAAVAPVAVSVPPGAPVSPVQPSSVSESAQSPTGAAEGALSALLPAEDPAPAETLIGSITIRSESVQLDNGECLRDLAVGDSVELRPDTGHEGLWIAAAFHGDYQDHVTLQHAEVVDDCGNDPAIACKFSGTRHAHPVDLDGKVRPRPTP